VPHGVIADPRVVDAMASEGHLRGSQPADNTDDVRSRSIAGGSGRVRTSTRSRRHGAKHRFSLDRRNWTPRDQLVPAAPLHHSGAQRDLQDFYLGETGFEPAAARPPAGTKRFCGVRFSADEPKWVPLSCS
jgi:hypothetical protein